MNVKIGAWAALFPEKEYTVETELPLQCALNVGRNCRWSVHWMLTTSFECYLSFSHTFILFSFYNWTFCFTVQDSTLFIICLPRVLCLSVCHNCFCLWSAELFFMFFVIKLTKETRRGFTDEGIRDGEICREKVEGGGVGGCARPPINIEDPYVVPQLFSLLQ